MPEIRIIDFESALLSTDIGRCDVGTDLYRAPELCAGKCYRLHLRDTLYDCLHIGLEWAQPIDIFSVGCIFAELITGKRLLYPCEDYHGQLACMEKVIGHFCRPFADDIERHQPGTFQIIHGKRFVAFKPSDGEETDYLRWCKEQCTPLTVRLLI
jgi:serine/threonine protein kinase